MCADGQYGESYSWRDHDFSDWRKWRHGRTGKNCRGVKFPVESAWGARAGGTRIDGQNNFGIDWTIFRVKPVGFDPTRNNFVADNTQFCYNAFTRGHTKNTIEGSPHGQRHAFVAGADTALPKAPCKKIRSARNDLVQRKVYWENSAGLFGRPACEYSSPTDPVSRRGIIPAGVAP